MGRTRDLAIERGWCVWVTRDSKEANCRIKRKRKGRRKRRYTTKKKPALSKKDLSSPKKEVCEKTASPGRLRCEELLPLSDLSPIKRDPDYWRLTRI